MFCGDVVVEVDRRNRALGDARATVDALVRIDEHLDAGESRAALAERDGTELVQWHRADDAVAGTDVDARGVTRADTFLGDDVGHVHVTSTHRAFGNCL
jgi:hypothetical protein